MSKKRLNFFVDFRISIIHFSEKRKEGQVLTFDNNMREMFRIKFLTLDSF